MVTPRHRFTKQLACAALALTAWGFAPRDARAQALVAVQLKDPNGQSADGTVMLLDGSGKTVASCEARQGSCEMKNVAGGSYTVTVKPAQGDPPKPRKVMIPPNGKVTLVVTSR